jgi:3-methyladenine DNA glycosylase AlkD
MLYIKLKLSKMTSPELIGIVEQHYQANRNPQKASEMSAYMRGLFPYLGIQRPQRDELNKAIFLLAKEGIDRTLLEETALSLFQKPEREYHYFALDLLLKHINLLNSSSLAIIEQIAQQHTWWDSIDFIATKIVSRLIEKYPVLWERIDELSVHENLWLRRMAIICQIPFKKKTDEKRLFQYCLANATDKDFFIRKAIGWALRQYSKTNPMAVKEFVGKYESTLSNLTQKEALRRI